MLGKVFQFLKGVILFYLAFVFLKWYIKGHFGKYFIFFWLNTIITFMMYFNHKNQIEQEYDHRTGAEIWEATH
jgi:hypothetical protein